MYYSKALVATDPGELTAKMKYYLNEISKDRILISIEAHPHNTSYVSIVTTKDKEKEHENESSGIRI